MNANGPQAVSEIFDRFAGTAGASVVARAVEKHGCWEWSAAQAGTMNRFTTLDIVSEPTLEGMDLLTGEIWFGAHRGSRFVRTLSSSFRLSQRTFDRAPTELSDAEKRLLDRLARAWKLAGTLQDTDLISSAPSTREDTPPPR
ncbi:MAG: hypothetical protein FJZ92_08100 [Chloroflexi bacterium]|nr:hypothetical protein [Chloroflexota bacterium]